jgi:hypothetical protein
MTQRRCASVKPRDREPAESKLIRMKTSLSSPRGQKTIDVSGSSAGVRRFSATSFIQLIIPYCINHANSAWKEATSEIFSDVLSKKRISVFTESRNEHQRLECRVLSGMPTIKTWNSRRGAWNNLSVSSEQESTAAHDIENCFDSNLTECRAQKRRI